MEIIGLIENTKPEDRKDLCVERGLSLLIRMDGKQILFDTGVRGGFAQNAQVLGMDLAAIDLAVISHHHYDHGGGLKTFLEANQKAKVFLRTSKTEQFFFVDHWGLVKRPIGLDASLFQQHPDRFVFVNHFTEITPNVFVLTDIEKNHPVPRGSRHLYMQDGHRRRRDDFSHELMLVIFSKRGLVLLSGCSHHGILNMIEATMAQFPGETIRAVIGGFHLIDRPKPESMAGTPEAIGELGRKLLDYPVDMIYTCHCTGLKAYPILKEAMGTRLEYFQTGQRLEF